MKDIRFGKLIGYGTERQCYENLDNSETCLKVSNLSACAQTRREIKYFQFLSKKGVHPSFLPKFYGSFTLANQIGFEQEYLRSTDTLRAVTLKQYILETDEEQFLEIEHFLENIKKEMIRFNVIISDMRTGNTLILIDNKQKIKRMVFVDGFGSPEFIPLPIYCPFFGRLKIERQWKKFMKKYQAEKNSRLGQLRH